jgi:cytoplasmic iron level regulating protein YaaA (DUF328/UPF0246 family)
VLVVLPPSETKRDGGTGEALDLSALAFPRLNATRRRLVRAVRALARDPEATVSALGLGPRQLAEIDRNRNVATSATMPVMDRFTGVLYDALDAKSLTARQREFAASHVAVHSALFGLVAASDPVPAYRLSHDSRLPDLSLKREWASEIGSALATTPGLLLDLRSEAYVALGPAPARGDCVYLRVVSEADSGRKRALNHFNKKAKGQLVRAIIENGHDFETVGDLLEWSAHAGFRLRHSAPGELELVVDQVAPTRSG